MRFSSSWIRLAIIAWSLMPAAAAVAAGAPSAPPDLLFRASFDRHTAFADFAKGDPKSTLDASLELRAKPGIRGNCLLPDPGEKCIYQAESNLNPSAGTISLWIKPANWSDADRRFVYFFVFQARFKDDPKKGFSLVVDKPDNPNIARAMLAMAPRGHPEHKQYISMGKAEWKTGEWNKLDATWDARHLAIYVNGRLANRQDLPNLAFPELTRATFELVPIWTGPDSQSRTSKDRTYADEVEIYNQVHSADRILERYLADRPDDAAARETLKTLPRRDINISFLPDVPGKRLGLEIDLSPLKPEWLEEVKAERATLEVGIEGAARGGSQKVKVTGPVATISLPFQFQEGKCTLRCTLRSPSRKDAFVHTEDLAVPDVSWVGTNVGVSDKVLEPWTALVCDSKGGISCWGRRYEFGGPLPAKVVNQGHDILRGPVRLTLETDQGKGDLVERSRRTVKTTPARVEFAGAASFGSLPVAVDWSSWVEYDGLFVGEFVIKAPRSGLKIESLTMRMPLRDGLKHLRGARQNPNRLDWDGKLWQSNFEPFLWLTSEDEGFLYFCESEANWVSAGDKAPMTILLGGDEPEIELRIIGRQVTAKEPLRYRFGFQATPVKPLDADWRDQNYGPGTPIKNQTHQPWMNGYSQYEGLWHVSRPEALRKVHEQTTSKGIRIYYYATTSCTPNNSPMYALFRKLWEDPFPAQFGPAENKESNLRPAAGPYFQAPVCPGAPTFVEYELWLAKRMAEEIGARGFYTDTDDIWQCDNHRHGCGFTDVFGKSGVTWVILGKREFAKRMATLMRSLGGGQGRGYWLTHAHSKLTPPVHCFADAFYPGEEYTHRLYNNKWYYIADMPEVDYRVQLSPLSSGLVHAFLPEFSRGTRDEQDIKVPGPSESLLAMCAVNDVNCTAAYMHRQSMEEWWGLRKRLGLGNAAFKAYWRPDCPVKTTTDEARVSTYTLPGCAVIAVANRRAQDTDIIVEADTKELGLRAGNIAAVDERTGQRLRIENGRFTVPVKARNYTFVSLR